MAKYSDYAYPKIIATGSTSSPQASARQFSSSTGPNPEPQPPEDGFSFSGALVGGAVAAAGASKLMLSEGPAVVGHNLRANWKSLSFSPALKVLHLAVMAQALPFAPLILPALAFFNGARQGAQTSDVGEAAAVASGCVQQWKAEVDSSKAWLRRVADKPFEPDHNNEYPLVSLGDAIQRPKESWNLIRSW